MTRRVVKDECGLEAFRETRPTVRRHFPGGTVLNVLQWVKQEIARFTVEGEGIEVWCCPTAVFDENTVSTELLTRVAGTHPPNGG